MARRGTDFHLVCHVGQPSRILMHNMCLSHLAGIGSRLEEGRQGWSYWLAVPYLRFGTASGSSTRAMET